MKSDDYCTDSSESFADLLRKSMIILMHCNLLDIFRKTLYIIRNILAL